MITIRPATASDQAALGRYGAALMREHHASDPRRFLLTERPEAGYGRFLVSQLADPDTTVLVAERDRAVAGYVYVGLEPLSWRELRGPSGFVHDLYVDESARRAGIGRELLESAIAWLRSRGMRQIVLWSKTKNASAQALFARVGFRNTMIEMTLDDPDGD